MGCQSTRDNLALEAIQEILALAGEQADVRKPGQLTVYEIARVAGRSRTRMATILQALVEEGLLESAIVFDEKTRHHVRVYWKEDGENDGTDSG